MSKLRVGSISLDYASRQILSREIRDVLVPKTSLSGKAFAGLGAKERPSRCVLLSEIHASRSFL